MTKDLDRVASPLDRRHQKLKLLSIGISPHDGIFSIGVSPHGLDLLRKYQAIACCDDKYSS